VQHEPSHTLLLKFPEQLTFVPYPIGHDDVDEAPLFTVYVALQSPDILNIIVVPAFTAMLQFPCVVQPLIL